jgi:hypothetical protein
MYREIVGTNSTGADEFDRLAPNYIKRLVAHKNKFGTMTQVWALSFQLIYFSTLFCD